jgi:hypothetical protein
MNANGVRIDGNRDRWDKKNSEKKKKKKKTGGKHFKTAGIHQKQIDVTPFSFPKQHQMIHNHTQLQYISP